MPVDVANNISTASSSRRRWTSSGMVYRSESDKAAAPTCSWDGRLPAAQATNPAFEDPPASMASRRVVYMFGGGMEKMAAK
ncbi:hypothetical protein E2562_008798 [Oryza meyeriana var. granulata]|uniref:Uncharacterized protein n=1 Tax=Oryza meyeriana var. granulata TaxID=110450 RepID=A0A6G1D026_9ORYZ|nr:hypothetical protein E2562_008798 [Oryza meyeriana var. granulata]